MNYPRMLEKDHMPSNEEILATINQTEQWTCLLEFMRENYDIDPQLVFYGKKYRWTLRYRKGSRTLLSLFPEQGAFSALIVLGKKEVEKVSTISHELGPDARKVFETTEQLHDGRWLWIRVINHEQVEDIKRLVQIKRRPIRAPD